MQKQPLRVWLYARTADARPGVLEEQLNSLYREAERRGYTVVNGGAEHRCAGDLDRPALFAMLAAVRGGRVDAVMLTRLSRFSYHRLALYLILCFLQDHGVGLITTEYELRYILYLRGFERMFDRLGRIESETPFVLEWFVQHGIQMWSVHEGQQRIESHGDKLMNYIRFWQAAGESEKTSIRTRDRIRQIVSSGHFAGGFVPYGYRAVDKGRVNKRDQPVKDLEIDPEEAAWVREVFEKVANEGASGYAMARMLNDRGLCTRQGARFQSVNIRRMIRHEGYTGYLITKAARSEFIQELQIVDEKLFARANEVIDCRSKKLAQEKNIAAKTNNPTLLAGIVVCAHCGAKMSAFLHTDRYKLADGTIREKVQAKYNCYQRGQKLRACDGQSLYLAERVDAVVLEVVHDIFRRIQQEPYDRSIEQKLRQENGEQERQKQAAEKKIKAAQYKQKRYEDEVIRCLDGQSRFSEEMLARLIAEAETEVRQAKEEYAELLRNDTTRATIQQIRSYYDEFLGWANEFDLATIPRKRAILGQLIEKVEVGKGYKVTVHLRMSYAQFLGIEGNGEIQVRKDVCA